MYLVQQVWDWAAQLAYQNFEQKKAHLNDLRRYFLEGIHKLDDVSINGWEDDGRWRGMYR